MSSSNNKENESQSKDRASPNSGPASSSAQTSGSGPTPGQNLASRIASSTRNLASSLAAPPPNASSSFSSFLGDKASASGSNATSNSGSSSAFAAGRAEHPIWHDRLSNIPGSYAPGAAAGFRERQTAAEQDWVSEMEMRNSPFIDIDDKGKGVLPSSFDTADSGLEYEAGVRSALETRGMPTEKNFTTDLTDEFHARQRQAESSTAAAASTDAERKEKYTIPEADICYFPDPTIDTTTPEQRAWIRAKEAELDAIDAESDRLMSEAETWIAQFHEGPLDEHAYYRGVVGSESRKSWKEAFGVGTEDGEEVRRLLEGALVLDDDEEVAQAAKGQSSSQSPAGRTARQGEEPEPDASGLFGDDALGLESTGSGGAFRPDFGALDPRNGEEEKSMEHVFSRAAIMNEWEGMKGGKYIGEVWGGELARTGEPDGNEGQEGNAQEIHGDEEARDKALRRLRGVAGMVSDE